jgi:dTDP-4-amino-4,6-dideoxygalactose transaminase
LGEDTVRVRLLMGEVKATLSHGRDSPCTDIEGKGCKGSNCVLTGMEGVIGLEQLEELEELEERVDTGDRGLLLPQLIEGRGRKGL